jgi:hypothetical protein
VAQVLQDPQGADILVHQGAGVGYLERHGFTGAASARMAALQTGVTQDGGVAERAGVRELIRCWVWSAPAGRA